MADKKIVFLDIDGTFIVPLEKPTELASRAVREARKNGHRILISTGRNMPIVSEDVLEVGFDGVVASAGRHIEIDGKVIRDSVLPEETIKKCLEIFHRFGIYCRIESPEGIKIIQGKLEHNKKRFPIPGAFLQHVFGDLIPLICCEAVKII